MTKRRKSKQVFNCSRCRDRNWLVECVCGKCGKIIFLRDKKGEQRSRIKGHGRKRWRADTYGRSKSGGGYWRLYIPSLSNSSKDGRVWEHVYFFQEYHKCCLLPWGEVHHKDGSRDYNMPWNLQGMMKRDHKSIHSRGNRYRRVDMSGRFCLLCKSTTGSVNSAFGEYYY